MNILDRITASLAKVKHITAYVEEDTLILVLICLILAFLSAAFVVLFMILLRRTILIREVRIAKNLIAKYEIFLSESMTYFYENNKIFEKKTFTVTLDKKDQTSAFNRKILLEQILLMKKHVGGEESQMLHDLYKKMRFYQQSLKKLKSWHWNIRLKGLQELIAMECTALDMLFHKMTRDKHPFVRIEAIRALILRDSVWQPSIIRYSYPLSIWEQFQICDALSNRQNIQLPNFTPLLKSLNPTVIVFALRMIKHFHSMEAIPQVEPFLNSENPVIVQTAKEVMQQFGWEMEIEQSDTFKETVEIKENNMLHEVLDLKDNNSLNEFIELKDDNSLNEFIDLKDDNSLNEFIDLKDNNTFNEITGLMTEITEVTDKMTEVTGVMTDISDMLKTINATETKKTKESRQKQIPRIIKKPRKMTNKKKRLNPIMILNDNLC